MSVRTLCLAILNFSEATGYEIRKRSTEGDFSYFEDASYGSIYPALARLEADGLVTVREEEARAGKRGRKVYAITEAGRAELKQSLAELPAPDTYRSPFLLVAMCAQLVGRDVIERAISHRIAQLDAEIAKLEQIRERTVGFGTHFIIDYGLNCMRNDRDYLVSNRARLEDFAAAATAGEKAEVV